MGESSEDQHEVPDGFEIVEIDETNYAEYREQIEAVVAKELKDGTLRLGKKKLDGSQPAGEAISLGELFGAMGSMMTAFAPPEQAEQLQEQLNMMTKVLDTLPIQVTYLKFQQTVSHNHLEISI